MAISDKPIHPAALQEFMKAVSPLMRNEFFARDHLTGNFEPDLSEIHVNEKTVFANPLAISTVVDDYTASNARDDHMVARLLEDSHQKLMRTVSNETRCAGCSHLDVKVEQNQNPMKGSTDYRLRTVCNLAKKGMTSLVCPDGSLTSMNTSGLDRGRVIFRQPPMVYMPPEDHKPADQPTTKSDDTAW